ncbi:MAG: IclR family transcriptional regulator [Lachnospiraceae bacterium]|nr:IclR family transcriptional regulator [Lachnospiraceae bacterium]
MENQKETIEKNPIQVADRLFQTLEALSSFGPIGLTELSNTLQLNKSTVHRILNSLIFMGYAKQDDATAKYSLTFKIWDIANQLLTHIDIIDIAKPHLRKLAELSGETVHLVQIDGVRAVYIDKVESYHNSVRLVSKVGSRIPLYCSGVGKALLAEMSPAQVEWIWKESDVKKLTQHTVTDFSVLGGYLQQIKKNGYALDNEENELGVRCIAACIKDYKGNPKYAFSISAPISRMSDARIQELSAYVLQTQKDLEAEWN